MLKKLKKIKLLWKDFQLSPWYRGILDSFRYSSSSEPVNYHFLVSFQMIIQIYNLSGMQGFYHKKEKIRETYASGVVIPFLIVLKLHLPSKCCIYQKSITLQLCWHLDPVVETCYLSCAIWSQSYSYFWHKVLSNQCCLAPQTYLLSLATFALLGTLYFLWSDTNMERLPTQNAQQPLIDLRSGFRCTWRENFVEIQHLTNILWFFQCRLDA